MFGSPDHSKGRQVKRREGKGKGRSKRTGRAFCGDEQAQDPVWWSEEDFAWWSKGKKGKKGLSKGNGGLQKGGFRPYQPDKGAGKDYHQNKGRGKDQRGKGREGTCPQSRFSPSETPNEEGYGFNPDFQPQKHPTKKDMAMPGNQTIGLPVSGLMILGFRCWMV